MHQPSNEDNPVLHDQARRAFPAPPPPDVPAPLDVGTVSSTPLVKELVGRFQWRKAFRYARWARIIVALAVVVFGGIASAIGAGLESLPFVNSGPVLHLGGNGRLDVIDPESLLVETALIRYGKAQMDLVYMIGEADRSLSRSLTGSSVGRQTRSDTWVCTVGVWADRMKDPSFRERLLDSVGRYVGDEYDTITVGEKESYLFSVRNYPNSAPGPVFSLTFYEDQILFVSGLDERHAEIYSNDLLSALP